MRDCRSLATARGWSTEHFAVPGGPSLCAFQRPGRDETSARRVYLSTGIHGDEPAGPLAARQLLADDRWLPSTSLWLCPCLNPSGFPLNQRENAQGCDLNRDYLHPSSLEIRAHTEWLDRQPTFDLSICLHEDWESAGFYLYEVSASGPSGVAEKVIRAVSSICPIDLAEEIEGRPASQGIIRPQIDPTTRLQWPEAFYLFQKKTGLSYTLEAPSDHEIEMRVAALVTAVNTLLAETLGSEPR